MRIEKAWMHGATSARYVQGLCVRLMDVISAGRENRAACKVVRDRQRARPSSWREEKAANKHGQSKC